MDDIVERLRDPATVVHDAEAADRITDQAAEIERLKHDVDRHIAIATETLTENERLRDIIDCGCNAIRDAVAVSGGDLNRIDAMQRRMRREMGQPVLPEVFEKS